ncbi:MAG: hypothetical protein MZU84_05885 [Sphingobacterium sp.]|nr:hypothetical protein [Sphingobacterium sp.]
MIKTHAQVGLHRPEQDRLPLADRPDRPPAPRAHQRLGLSRRALAGKDILLEAKILCVADVVEAMSSHRPYRPALGIGAALEEVSQKQGLLYDRDVVDACLRSSARRSSSSTEAAVNTSRPGRCRRRRGRRGGRSRAGSPRTRNSTGRTRRPGRTGLSRPAGRPG